MMQRVRFSADGIRGIAEQWPLTPQGSRQLGCALGQLLHKNSEEPDVLPVALIARDTRPSGEKIKNCLIGGLLSQGVDVIDLGIMTTPGVAYLTRKLLTKDFVCSREKSTLKVPSSLFTGSGHERASLGIIVTASHNPVEYNGIKLVDSNGLRLQEEKEIEDLINEPVYRAMKPARNQGQQIDPQDLTELYIQDQVELYPSKPMDGLKLVLDCANGAASQVAPQAFSQLGAKVVVTFDDLTGKSKINHQCGSEHVRRDPQALIATVRRENAEYGLAFDGDGDRLAIVDKEGHLYNGDDFLFILATYFHGQEKLRDETIVTTHMANSGLEEALGRLGIKTVYTEHGDKHLEAKIGGEGYLLGSEQVGNVIINDEHHTAADSLYAALILCGITLEQGSGLHSLVSPLKKRPQVLASIHLARTDPLGHIASLQEQKKCSLLALGNGSRVLTWYSSTEHGLFKTMVEGRPDNTLKEVEHEAVAICRAVQEAIGAKAQDPSVLHLSSRKRVRSAVD